MIRSAAPRALPKPSLLRPQPSRFSLVVSSASRRSLQQLASKPAQRPLALTAFQAKSTSVIRHYASAAAPGTFQRLDKEAEFGEKTLPVDPTNVSTTSSVQPIFAPEGSQKDEDVDMMAGIRHDIRVIKDTFAVSEVPEKAMRLGYAGVLPYLATSTATMYCAFEFNHAAHSGGSGWLMSEHTAELCLHVLEPLQVGYGAVIISFLGAIHWGLEWAKYGGVGGYRRYAIGVIAPAVAWPTILLPVEYALITQFLTFNLLYAVDAQTTVRGWTPPWYSTYRFILTFVVGASIVLSLIGRGQVADRIGTMPSAAERVKELRERNKEEKQAKKSKKRKSEDDE